MTLKLEHITRRLQTIRNVLDPPLGPDALALEIRAGVLDAIEKKVAILGINDRAFPYNSVVVTLLPSDTADEAVLERSFAGFEARVRARLAELRCDIPPSLAVTVSIVPELPRGWTDSQRFAVACSSVATAVEPTPPSSAPRLELAIVSGTAAQEAYTFEQPVVTVGRTAEVHETRGRARRNQVAFDAQTSTVSRAHATVRFDSVRGEYRVLDDGSARGTRVVRGDSVITVPRDPRGVRIQSGDEIRFGDAAVRVTIR